MRALGAVRCAHSAAQGEVRKVALVQGASRGLGLEFVSSLLARQADSRGIATLLRHKNMVAPMMPLGWRKNVTRAGLGSAST